MTSGPQITILDTQDGDSSSEAAAGHEVWLWQSFAVEGRAFSIPRYLEDHAERIRAKYLAFIHELGERVVAGDRVIDHLDRGDGFSLWWMTLLAEKSPLKSPAIYTCLRLIALDEILRDRPRVSLVLVSCDETLATSIGRLCATATIRFRWQQLPRPAAKWTLRRLYEALPHALKGLLSLRHAVSRWPLRAVRNPPWFSGNDAAFICSYFIHLDPALAAQGRFHSRQWEELPHYLRGVGRKLNWLQVFLFSAAVPDVATGLAWSRRFNGAAGEQGCHAFVDSYLSVRTVLTALGCWLWLGAACRRLRTLPELFDPAECATWLWPVLRSDWYSSLRGTAAMANCLVLALFDAALAAVPRQRLGLYLYENQSWEKAFLRAWKKHGHGEIIGVQHATVPFWHLYYFEDPRSFSRRPTGALPLPDLLAVNGNAARDAFAAGHFPSERLVEVEALRYLNLLDVIAERHARGPVPAGSESSNDRAAVRVLVLGDLIPASMHHLLRLLEQAFALAPPGFEFTLKPHPGLDVDLGEYPGLDVAVTRDSLTRILGQFHVAVSANCTSAAVDAFIGGLPVIIALDGNGLNLSPLRGSEGVRFVSTGAELAAALAEAKRDTGVTDRSRDEFFHLSGELSRWRRLFGAATRAR